MKIFAALCLSITIAICFTNCKKSKNATTTATPVIDTPFIYGYLEADIQDEQDAPGDTFTVIEYASVRFLNDSITNSLVYPDYAVVNGDTLPSPNFNNFYSFNFAGGVNWNILGNTSVPSISYSSPGTFPDYLGTIPDTVIVLNGMTLNISPQLTNNADFIKIILSGPVDGGYVGIYSTSSGTITIPSSELAYYFSPEMGHYAERGLAQIEVIASKYDYTVINGKRYQFLRTKTILKPVYVL